MAWQTSRAGQETLPLIQADFFFFLSNFSLHSHSFSLFSDMLNKKHNCLDFLSSERS